MLFGVPHLQSEIYGATCELRSLGSGVGVSEIFPIAAETGPARGLISEQEQGQFHAPGAIAVGKAPENARGFWVPRKLPPSV